MSAISDLLGLGGAWWLANEMGSSDVPSTGKMTADSMQAVKDNLPDYLAMLRQEAPKQALAEAQLRDQFAGRRAASDFRIADEYLPKYGQIGRDESYFNKMLGSAGDLDTMRGPGGELVKEVYSQARGVDPEFYAQRGQTQQGLSSLLRSMYDADTTSPTRTDQFGKQVANERYDPSRPQGYFTGRLSGGEREEIERALGRQGVRTGSGTGPRAMSDVVGNAMTFGQGMQNRRNAFGQALQQATSFLPASRSGFDPLQVALGRPTSNSYGAQFSQPNVNSQNVMNQGSNMFNMAGNMARTSAGLQAGQPSTLQNMGQLYQTFPGLQNQSW